MELKHWARRIGALSATAIAILSAGIAPAYAEHEAP